jgi:NADPH-dependent curcumin reductase CurA
MSADPEMKFLLDNFKEYKQIQASQGIDIVIQSSSITKKIESPVGRYMKGDASISNGKISNLPASTGAIFKAGDFIMIGGYSYKITADVPYTGSTATVSIHRPVIGSPVSGAAVACGNNCTFTVLAEKCPTYTLTPYPASALVNWDDAFVFREDIT